MCDPRGGNKTSKVLSHAVELRGTGIFGLYSELSFSLSEAGGEHRWKEREGGNTAGRRQNMGALRAVKAEQLTSDSRREDSMKSKRASDEVRCTRNDSERMLVPNK